MIQDLLRQALDLESKNQLNEALKIYTAALAQEPHHKEVLLHMGSCLFAMGTYDKALEYFVMSYMHQEQTTETKEFILQDLLSAYYQPNQETFRNNYEKNVARLKAYQHNYIQDFLPFDDLNYLCIPASEDTFYLFEKNTKNFSCIIQLKRAQRFEDISPQNCYLGVNIFEAGELEELIKDTTDPAWLNGVKSPFYLIWENKAFLQAYLQIADYETLIAGGRLVFFDAYTPDSALMKFFSDIQSVAPTSVLGEERHFPAVVQIIKDINQSRSQNFEDQIAEINQFYAGYNRDYYRNLFRGDLKNIRILFFTSRFTQVVQYGTRDFMKACQNLGIQCELLIEHSDIHWTSGVVLIEKVAQFKPDIIFRINYFRNDFHNIPENLMFITWVQDIVVQLDSRKHAELFGIQDYILSHAQFFIERLIKTGFPKERINFQTVPVDDTVFHFYELSTEERKRYSSDVMVCGNYSPVNERDIPEMIEFYSKDVEDKVLQDRIKDFFNQVYQYLKDFVQGGGFISDRNQFETIIDEYLDRLELIVPEHMKHFIAERLFNRVFYGLLRLYGIQSLARAKINLKVWGKGWDQFPDIAPYAQGWVQHGEELAKVYSASKMVIGSFSHSTAYSRIWEAISCGALCMVRYLPPEDDLFDIRQFLTDGEHFVFYRNPEDLVEKIDYYLRHEDQRLSIVENAKKCVQQKLTYAVAVKNWLDFINNDLQKQESYTGVS